MYTKDKTILGPAGSSYTRYNPLPDTQGIWKKRDRYIHRGAVEHAPLTDGEGGGETTNFPT